MASKITLRPAVPEDLDELLVVFYSAFHDSALNARSFPPSDPESHDHHVKHFQTVLDDTISEVLIAEVHSEAGTDRKPVVAGWARWLRKPSPGTEQRPRPVYTPDMYPRGGDGAFAARFFQANTDQIRRIVGVEDHWFLSIMLVRKDYQRTGVGSLLMQYGVEKADREGWMAAVNGSSEGRPLYERFGFRTIATSEFDEAGVTTYHMKRDARKKDS